jgi:signal peptidase I
MEQPIIEQPALIKPRNGFIAFLLSLFFPGLGQIYNGHAKKGVIFFGLLLLISLLFGVIRLTTSFYGLFCLLFIQIALRIYIIIDGVKNATRQKEYILKSYNTWYYHLLIAVGMFAVMFYYDSSKVLGIQTFKIPTTANNPTLQVGDLFIADLKAYKNTEPEYGDIVVYSGPDNQIYTFRVVGLPHDNIELIDNLVSINGKPGNAVFIKETINDGIPVELFKEKLPNGDTYYIYKYKVPYDITKSNIKNIVVPSDSYYVLGDNRDNALDSRYVGFISKDKIIGRILFSYRGKEVKSKK